MFFADTTYTVSLVPFMVIDLVVLALGILIGISIANKRHKK